MPYCEVKKFSVPYACFSLCSTSPSFSPPSNPKAETLVCWTHKGSTRGIVYSEKNALEVRAETVSNRVAECVSHCDFPMFGVASEIRKPDHNRKEDATPVGKCWTINGTWKYACCLTSICILEKGGSQTLKWADNTTKQISGQERKCKNEYRKQIKIGHVEKMWLSLGKWTVSRTLENRSGLLLEFLFVVVDKTEFLLHSKSF